MYFKKFLYHRKCIHFKEFNLCKQQTVSEGELPVFLYITGQKGKNKSLLPGQQKAKFKKGENIMNVPKKFISDTYEELFTDEAEFQRSYTEMEDCGHWENHCTGDTSLQFCSGPMFLGEVTNSSRVGIDPEAIYDALNPSGSKLFLGTVTGTVPMRVQAISQLISTALALRDEKQGQDELDDPVLFERLYEAAANGKFRANRTNQFWICGDKVTAVGSSDYEIMPIDDVFFEVLQTLRQKFTDLKFVSGYNSFVYTRGTYEILGTERDTLLDAYKDMIARNPHKVREIKNIQLLITIMTSNAKSSAAIVSGIIMTDRGVRIPVGTSIRIDHKRRSGSKDNIELLLDRIPELYAKFCDPKSKFAEMTACKIYHPKDCLINLAKKAQLPLRLVGACASNLEAYLAGDPVCTMMDVYLSLCEMTGIALAKGSSSREIDQLEEGIARILGYNWSEQDYETTK